MYSQVIGAAQSSVCLLCPDGTFSATAGVSVCSACPKGTFGVASGATTNATCSPCPQGSYGNASGVSTCFQCPFNSYSNAVAAVSLSACTPCEAGFGTMSLGSTLSSACQLCPVGFWYSSMSGCKVCPAGSWSSTINATSESQCISCVAGTYSPLTNATTASVCTPCPPGSKSAAGATSCGACPAGTTSGSAENTCVDCVQGTYGASAGLCSPCPAGTTSAAGAVACDACPPGTYQLFASCVPCVAGSYQSNSSATACSLCPAGTYGNIAGQWSAAAACVPCGAGLYSTSQGASSPSVCRPCLPGTYQTLLGASASTACLPCPANTFSNVSAAVSADSCQPCPTNAQCYVGAQAAEVVASPSIVATGGSVQSGVLYGSDVGTRQDFSIQIATHVNTGQHNLDVIMLLIAVFAVVLATIVGFTACRAPALEVTLLAADWVFARAHRTLHGKPIVARKTPLGGLMTFTLAMLVLLVLIYLALQFSLFNQSVLSTVVAGQIPMSPKTNLTVSVQAAAYGGECNPSSGSLQPTSSGVLYTIPPTYSVSYSSNRTCTIVWQCTGCTMSTPASVQVSFGEDNAAAAMLQWQILATPVIASETNTVRGFVQSTSTAAVFRGSQTSVQIAVFNTLFTDAVGSTLAGVRLFNGSVEPGALQDAQTYNQQSGVSVLFDLQLFVGYAQVAVLAPISWVNLFTSIFSLCGAVFTISGLALALLEFTIVRVRPNARFVNSESASDDDLSEVKSGRLRLPSQASVMTNPLYRAPASPTEEQRQMPSEYSPGMTQKGIHGVQLARVPGQQPRGGYDDL
eukprot:TRINITY_DN3907_c0_g1_i3.p1 TRINITY_DN3907_c0_g1~~TRINITY_DN3907_c0_g1_i3.p1  ORF type:complete len:803 (-),score=104.48 TRINITY_DN3907_c0_g1_i3:104-2512(-)